MSIRVHLVGLFLFFFFSFQIHFNVFTLILFKDLLILCLAKFEKFRGQKQLIWILVYSFLFVYLLNCIKHLGWMCLWGRWGWMKKERNKEIKKKKENGAADQTDFKRKEFFSHLYIWLPCTLHRQLWETHTSVCSIDILIHLFSLHTESLC